MRYSLLTQEEMSGKKSFILTRENGSKTSALSTEEAYAILFLEEITKDLTELVCEIDDLDDNNVMFGDEIRDKINGKLLSFREDKLTEKIMEIVNNEKTSTLY